MMGKKHPAVFLDRDGVLTIEKKTILHPSQVELCEGAAGCVRRLKDAGFIVVVITNQSGIARGLFTEDELISLHEKLKAETGADAIYYCPHHPEGSVPEYSFICDCRKPKTGMIERACRDFDLDLSRSWIIGDRESDILTGRAAGLKTILVRCGYGEDELTRGVSADVVAANLNEAVEIIIESREGK